MGKRNIHVDYPTRMLKPRRRSGAGVATTHSTSQTSQVASDFGLRARTDDPSHQQFGEILVRQCGSYKLDTGWRNIIDPYEPSRVVVILSRAYVLLASILLKS